MENKRMFKCVNLKYTFTDDWAFTVGRSYELEEENIESYTFKLKDDEGQEFYFNAPKECFEEVEKESDNLKDLPKDMFKNSAKSSDIKLNLCPDPEEIVISDIQAIYVQKSDSNDDDEFQELKIRTQDSGGGNYFAIKTERWSFDDVDELIKVLKDFKNRIK